MRLPAPASDTRSVFRCFDKFLLQGAIALLFAAVFPAFSRAQTAPLKPALITQPGGTIAMPCASGSPNCTVTNKSDIYGVLSGFSTTTGYGMATGLGSVDANNLVTKWSSITTKGSATTLTLSPTPVKITHGQPVNVSINVTAAAPATA
jgi:hypothetical protein